MTEWQTSFLFPYIEPIAQFYAAQITKLHSHLRANPFRRSETAHQIHSLFRQITDPLVLERTKHLISEEEKDYLDLRALLTDLKNSRNLLELLRTPSLNYFNSTIVLCDVDNTLLENHAIANIRYHNKSVIPGIVDLLNYLSKGFTTVTFLSARPKHIEGFSIAEIKSKLSEHSLRNFTFESGEIRGTVSFVAAKLSSASSEMRKKFAIESAMEYARLKFESYLQFAELYPASRFVFFGDDTQGDAIAAWLILSHSAQNQAFIRRCAFQGESVFPGEKWFPPIKKMIELYQKSVARSGETVFRGRISFPFHPRERLLSPFSPRERLLSHSSYAQVARFLNVPLSLKQTIFRSVIESGTSANVIEEDRQFLFS